MQSPVRIRNPARSDSVAPRQDRAGDGNPAVPAGSKPLRSPSGFFLGAASTFGHGNDHSRLLTGERPKAHSRVDSGGFGIHRVKNNESAAAKRSVRRHRLSRLCRALIDCDVGSLFCPLPPFDWSSSPSCHDTRAITPLPLSGPVDAHIGNGFIIVIAGLMTAPDSLGGSVETFGVCRTE